MTIQPSDNFLSADVTVETDDENMALKDGNTSGNLLPSDDANLLATKYETLYTFTVTAEFTSYPSMG